MRKLIFYFVLLLSTTGFCQTKKDTTVNKVEYTISATNADAKLIINYRDEKEQFTGGSGQSGWVYSFETSKKPFTTLLLVNIYPTKIKKTTVTLKILINGVVAEEKPV
jgi:hypothetical protein